MRVRVVRALVIGRPRRCAAQKTSAASYLAATWGTWGTLGTGIILGDPAFQLGQCSPLVSSPVQEENPNSVADKMKRYWDTNLDSTSSSCQDLSVEDSEQDLLDRLCVEAAVRDPSLRLLVQGVYEISTEDLCPKSIKARSLFKLSLRDLWTRSLFSSPGLCLLIIARAP